MVRRAVVAVGSKVTHGAGDAGGGGGQAPAVGLYPPVLLLDVRPDSGEGPETGRRASGGGIRDLTS